LSTVPSPNHPPGGRPAKVTEMPLPERAALSLLIFSSPSMTPNQ
jgi:hypothetical protein